MPIYKPFPKNFWENNFQQEGGGHLESPMCMILILLIKQPDSIVATSVYIVVDDGDPAIHIVNTCIYPMILSWIVLIYCSSSACKKCTVVY